MVPGVRPASAASRKEAAAKRLIPSAGEAGQKACRRSRLPPDSLGHHLAKASPNHPGSRSVTVSPERDKALPGHMLGSEQPQRQGSEPGLTPRSSEDRGPTGTGTVTHQRGSHRGSLHPVAECPDSAWSDKSRCCHLRRCGDLVRTLQRASDSLRDIRNIRHVIDPLTRPQRIFLPYLADVPDHRRQGMRLDRLPLACPPARAGEPDDRARLDGATLELGTMTASSGAPHFLQKNLFRPAHVLPFGALIHCAGMGDGVAE